MKLSIKIFIYIIYLLYEFLIKPIIFIIKILFRLFIKVDYNNIIGIEYYDLCLPDFKNYLLTCNSKLKVIVVILLKFLLRNLIFLSKV